MSEHTDFSALEWVKGEINESLRQAQQALEAYVANPKDSTKMQFCITHLHQVWGTLQMVELQGATLFAAEMEALAQSLLDGTVPKVHEAHEVLMQAFLQLPSYLESMSTGSKDLPVVLLSVLNDLRSTRGETLMSETALFTPDLDSGNKFAEQRQESDVAVVELEEQLTKIRSAYQKSLLNVIKREALEKNLEYMGKILARLQKLSGKSQVGQLWWIGGAMLDGLLNGSIELSKSVNGLLAALDRQIKEMVDDHKKVLSGKISGELAKNLLYYVASSDPSTVRISNVQKAYKLSRALPKEVREQQSQQARRGLVGEAIVVAVKVLIEDVLNIKESLDLVVRSKDGGQEKIKELLPALKNAVGALDLLALYEAKDTLEQQCLLLEACVSGHEKDIKHALMSVAGHLLGVEASLADIAKHGLTGKILIGEIASGGKVSSDQLGVAQKALLQEAISSLEMVKELFAALFASGWEKENLHEAANILKAVAGVVNIIPLPLVSQMLNKSAAYIEQQLLTLDSAPEQKELETFADVLSSIDYYLEKLFTDSRTDDASLKIGRARLNSLGFSVDNEKDLPPNNGIEKTQTNVAISLQEKRPQDIEAKAESQVAKQHIDIDEVPVALELVSEIASEPTSESENEIEQNEPANQQFVGHAEEVTSGESEEAQEAQVEQEHETPALETSGINEAVKKDVGKSQPENESIIDDEIIEIFVEEVGEVQETLARFLPLWIKNIDDQSSLTEVRRAFHTLKGSGRLVGATELGEMAWSIENMLNRVIDKTIKPIEDVLNTVQAGVNVVPELLELFKQTRNESTERSRTTVKEAEVLATGGRLGAASLQETDEQDDLSDAVMAAESADGVAAEGVAFESPTLVLDGKGSENEEETFEQPEHDEEIIEIFCQEARGHLDSLNFFLESTKEKTGPWIISDEVLRTMHTLKGCANMAAIQPVAPVVTKAENFVKELRLQDKKANQEVIDMIASMTGFADKVIVELPRVSSFSHKAANALLEQIAALSENLLYGTADADIEGDSGKQERIERFLGFHFDSIFDLEDYLADYFSTANDEALKSNRENLGKVAAETSGVAALAKSCELDEIAQLADAIAVSLLHAEQQTLSEDFYTDLQAGGARLIEIVDFLAAGQFIKSPAKLSEKLQQHIAAMPPLGDVPQVDTQVDAQVEIPETQQTDENIVASLPVTEEDDQDLLEEEIIVSLPVDDGFEEVSEQIHEAAAEEEEIFASLPVENLSEPDVEEQEVPLVAASVTNLERVMDVDVERDEEIIGIFLEEAEEIIERSANLLDHWASHRQDITVVAELQRDLHTMKGGARMAEYAAVGDLGHELENIYEGVCTDSVSVSDRLFEVLFRCHDRLSEMLLDIRNQGNCYRADDLIAEIKLLVDGVEMPDEAVATPEDEIESVPLASVEGTFNEQVIEESEEIEFSSVEDTSPESHESSFEDSINLLAEETDPTDSDDDEEEKEEESELDVDVELVEIFLEEAEEIIESSANALEEWRNDLDNTAHVEKLQRELHTLKGGARMAQIPAIGDFSHEMENLYEGIVNRVVDRSDRLINLLLVCHDRLNEMVTSLRASGKCENAEDLTQQVVMALQGEFVNLVETPATKPSKAVASAKQIALESNIELELVELFLVDGVAVLQNLEQHIEALKSSHSKKNISQAREVLSGLVGGAKLSGFKSLADYCKYVDTLIEAQDGKSDSHQELKSALAQIKDFVGLLENDKKSRAAQKLKPLQKSTQKAETKTKQPAVAQQATAQQVTDKEKESIKVPAELLETLVNLAGETSINRGRLEMQLSEFAFTIEEMTGTIERLQEQLRRLHLETEAQIVFRHESEKENKEVDEDFDPLEMDRYSAIDQLSRSLSESASDLFDLKDTLVDKVRDAETLLLQQSRVNTELQEGLMRSRMVPFSRLLPRLRRIVRQVGNELKKPVDLEVLNAEGELDRAVLERMVSPMEHMLRNSIAHGVEKAEDRKKANKAANGTITIQLGREGSSMVINIKDDGAGVNVEAVKKKAIQNGLMDVNANLSDDEIVEFIFNPGFSTATEVSQVAGRGVGMDVVASEIKQLSGTIETHSVTGVGTTFIIRLPFTVAVNRALMVGIGDDYYAIPLSSIEGVVRVSPYELEAYYEQEDPVFNYAGVNYQLQYLGSYMHGRQRANLLGHVRPLPVLLVQSSDHAVAIQVDALFGSREIVVKSVGPQLSTVAGISGATILGDGSVVIILDIHSMIRGAIAQKESISIQASVVESRKERRVLKVMVVDDSVTVRKVTSRLLERNGMEVLLAKDGVDAITQLQEVKPDIMLLDIEMPRMDGFEVATLVRHDERLQDLPIIMITSRTGEKHKERAMSIGVNRYLGKPFQENVLLENIAELTSQLIHQK